MASTADITGLIYTKMKISRDEGETRVMGGVLSEERKDRRHFTHSMYNIKVEIIARVNTNSHTHSQSYTNWKKGYLCD